MQIRNLKEVLQKKMQFTIKQKIKFLNEDIFDRELKNLLAGLHKHITNSALFFLYKKTITKKFNYNAI